MSSETSNALNAISTLIGYIGTEVATDDFFNRLLWPRRAYNGFSWKHIPQARLLMPMGGPLHRAALTTLDGFYRHGLYEPYQNGHMLGTAFFQDMKLKYRVFGHTPGYEDEHVRNGLFIQSIMNMRPPLARSKQQAKEGGDVPMSKHKVRQAICVSCLKLSRTPVQGDITQIFTVHDDACHPTVRTYLALCATELSGITVAVVVAVVWKTAFSLLWLLPLLLKILSTAMTVHREKLEVPELPKKVSQVDKGGSEKENNEREEIKLFGVRNPAGGFVIIEASEALALQFFRHYGHPVRSKIREKIQIAIVVAFTLLFPLGLVTSTLWMSDALQKTWVGYQLYATMAMYAYRYTGGHKWFTTEDRIGKAFFDAESAGRSTESTVILKTDSGDAISAQLIRTCHGRFAEALAHVEQIINVYQNAHLSRCGLMPADRSSSDMSAQSSVSNRNRNTEAWH